MLWPLLWAWLAVPGGAVGPWARGDPVLGLWAREPVLGASSACQAQRRIIIARAAIELELGEGSKLCKYSNPAALPASPTPTVFCASPASPAFPRLGPAFPKPALMARARAALTHVRNVRAAHHPSHPIPSHPISSLVSIHPARRTCEAGAWSRQIMYRHARAGRGERAKKGCGVEQCTAQGLKIRVIIAWMQR